MSQVLLLIQKVLLPALCSLLCFSGGASLSLELRELSNGGKGSIQLGARVGSVPAVSVTFEVGNNTVAGQKSCRRCAFFGIRGLPCEVVQCRLGATQHRLPIL